jgi:hypothetical protein
MSIHTHHSLIFLGKTSSLPLEFSPIRGSTLVLISPIFYEQLFHTTVFCAAFMCLQFGFVIFWQKGFGAKAAYKILVKLAPGRI